MGERKWNYAVVCCQAKPWLLVLLMCLAAFVQGFVVNGLVNITISPLQKRFQLSSEDMGLVASSYDIASIICVLPITFLCAKAHKGLVIGLSFTFLGLGSIVYSLPHFIAESYSDQLSALAQAGNDTNTCSIEDCSSNTNALGITDNRFYYGFFIAGQLLNGIGAAALYTTGTVFIDENLSQKGAPMAIGYFEGTSVLGPAIGFLGGGALLSMWVDGDSNNVNDYVPDDELFIGNWWIGYIIGGVAGIVIGILIAFLPRELKTAAAKQVVRRQEHQKGQIDKTTAQTGSAKDSHRSFWLLLQNPPFLFLIMAGGFEGGFIANASTYGTKYVEEIYEVSASTAAIVVGAVVVLAGAVGQTIGGLWVGKTNPTVRKQLIFGVTCLTISLASSFVIFYHCDETLFVGANLSYEKAMNRNGVNFTDDDRDLSAFDTANFDDGCFDVTNNVNSELICECDLSQFDPVCINGLSYFSSCFAGCNSQNISEISSCQCVQEADPVVIKGSCPRGNACYYEVFLALYFCTLFFTFVNGVPATNSILRMVPPELRSQAMGLNILFLRLIGTIPGPIIGGILVDKTCALWQTSCGENGSCRLYDRENFMYTWIGLHLVYKILGLACWFLSIFTYKPDGADGVQIEPMTTNSEPKEAVHFENPSFERNEN